jgi:hypothetical protein
MGLILGAVLWIQLASRHGQAATGDPSPIGELQRGTAA